MPYSARLNGRAIEVVWSGFMVCLTFDRRDESKAVDTVNRWNYYIGAEPFDWSRFGARERRIEQDWRD